MSSMFMKTFFSFLLLKLTTSTEDGFIFNGFSRANLHRDGVASITSTGLLELTNSKNTEGHAFYPDPLRFKSAAGEFLSFSTTFVFAIDSQASYIGGQGIAFVVSPTTDFSTASPDEYLGLLNSTSDGKSTNRILAIELDTNQNPDFRDIDGNHIGIDINSLISNRSHTAGYFEDGTDSFKNLSLHSGQPMQVWIDFSGAEMQLNVTLSGMRMPKPTTPLLSSTFDLGSVIMDSMYVGFSSANGVFHAYNYILGWSFKMNGVAEALDYGNLPSVPRIKVKGNSHALAMWLPVTLCTLLLLIIGAIVLIVRRNSYAELLEDWELEYGPHRFSYKDLLKATKGFKQEELLGIGGFGRVYRGVLPNSKVEVAVKKVSYESGQGMREFVAEIVSIGHLRHRNLVQLLGYCRRKGELLLVYELMPNGSLDKFLYDWTKPTLSWAQRFRIIKGVASGLLYLHEDWERVVVHRDIKASNVLLDCELNGKLGDFGLARLYDHGADPQTTRIVGTMGYLAPEFIVTCKATTVSDVFAFGVFLLEVVCGRRPINSHVEGEVVVLIDWVLQSWRRGLLIETLDPRLGREFCVDEAELVLKLGLLCSHPTPAARPSMRQVMHILDGDAELPELLPSCLQFCTMSSLLKNLGFDDYIISFASSAATLSDVLSGGR